MPISSGYNRCDVWGGRLIRSIDAPIHRAMNFEVRWLLWPSIRSRILFLSFRHVLGIKQCSNHSRPSASDVQPLLEVACIQSEGVSSGNQLELVFLALKIRHGSRVTPEALIHSIEVIHSWCPRIFLNLRSSLRVTSLTMTLLFSVDPKLKPDSSIL